LAFVKYISYPPHQERVIAHPKPPPSGLGYDDATKSPQGAAPFSPILKENGIFFLPRAEHTLPQSPDRTRLRTRQLLVARIVTFVYIDSMSRPSRNQDKLLIETAKRLLPKLGSGNMSLKRLSQESGVNLGMIHYYFRTKSVLLRRVLESVHEELLKEFESHTLIGATPLERLRSGLIGIALGIRRRRQMIVSFLGDMISGQDREVAEFFCELTARRIQVIAPLIQQCQREGYIEPLPFYQVLGFCMAGVNFPTILAEGINRLPTRKIKLPDFVVDQLAGEKAIIQRVDLALKAVSCKERRRT